MNYLSPEYFSQRIKEFQDRIKLEGREFCLELYNHSLLRVMGHKYAYYILDKQIASDVAYDIEEKSWYVMGRALGLIKEDEITPCVDFNESHPVAEAGKAWALTFKGRWYNGK